ncbi:sigma factor-like helix-turn-helix DNA-binding protein [Paenibacillus sp. PDC88]|uniref:sigma factor-like helix-turn-helix DNA-binding protein n=1 Tax=Paenibacillus sp. PDC88 TaxID=1884375 RepID=UPI00210CCB24|nr:sigma factor-like helix-turn-helix DNA-binding protein [Paenibacillus sp. PDC88]
MRDRHKISSARYKGDTDASCLLIDLNSAIYNAGLTERQTEAIALVYGFDVTQAQAATVMGIAQKNVSETIDRATESIAAVYRKWEYEDVTVEYTQDIEEEAHAA